MSTNLVLNRNEDTSQYFEKIFAAVEFAKMLTSTSNILRIEIKPDRKHGAKRRIEDLTKVFEDGSIEVIQLKYTDNPTAEWSYSALWQTRTTIAGSTQSSRYEGTTIFKFLKSWRFHSGKNKNVKLVLISNKNLGSDLLKFYSDIQKLRDSDLNWTDFSEIYADELTNIKANFLNCRLKRGELEGFIRSLVFNKTDDILGLDLVLKKELNNQGVFDNERIESFILRTFRKFTQNDIAVRRPDVEHLLEIVRTSLVHEIDIPKNYIQRDVLEKKIIQSIETQKSKGGFVFLFAPSGSGKTVLLSNLTQKNEDFLPYLCRIRPFERVGSIYNYQKERLSNKWFKADLIQRFFEWGFTKETVSLKDNEDWINLVFDRVLRQVSESALKRPNKKIVIIVDALDQIETDSYKDKSILDAIPSIKYPGVVFLLSTWGERYIPRNLIGDKILIKLGFTESEIKQYFLVAEIKLTPDQVRNIFRKTQGLAISLLYLTQKLKKVLKDEYDAVIDSQHEYREVFDWYKPIWESLNDQQRHALGCLSFHFTEIQKNRLFEITKIGLSNFSILNEKISPFISIKSGYIEPYHDSFRRFIINKLKDFTKEYHKEIIEYYLNEKNLSLDYAKKYLTAHLGAVGLNNSMIKVTTEQLINKGFIKKVINSNLDTVSKSNSVAYFISYFNAKNDLENFIKYAFQVSNLSSLVNDDDVFLKASIGSTKLLREVEDDLGTIAGSSIYSLREWILKRVRIGVMLKQQNDPLSNGLATHLLEDSLARISFNKEILWPKDESNDIYYWDRIEDYLEACTSLGRYSEAINYILNIRFKDPKPSTIGFRMNLIVAMNKLQYLKDKKSVLKSLSHLPQSFQLIGYSYLFLEYRDPTSIVKLRSLVKNKVLYKYLMNSKHENQYLDIAEIAYILGPENQKKCIDKLVQRQDFDPPYYRDHSYWGQNGKSDFLRKAAILSLNEADFNEKDFYIDSLKKLHTKHFEDYNNEAFTSIVVINILLVKQSLKVRKGEIKWLEFRSFLREKLNIFKNEIIKAVDLNQLTDYSFRKTAYVYYENVNSFIKDCLSIVGRYFPKYLESVVVEIENIFSGSVLEQNQALAEIILEELLPLTDGLKRKIDYYYKKVLDNKNKEKLGNIEKSESLKSLSRMMNAKGYKYVAEQVYRSSLRYSRGLSSKEDFRIINLIDCLRTRTEKNEFDQIFGYIDDIGNALEGSWYYKLAFIESTAIANFELSLDYLSDLTVKGQTNLNEGLARIITSSLSKNPFKQIISELLPLLDILRFDEEMDHNDQKNFKSIYHKLIECSLINDETSLAKMLLDKYYVYLKRYLYIGDRLRVLQDLMFFLKDKKVLQNQLRDIRMYVNQKIIEGYIINTSSQGRYQIVADDQADKAKNIARKKSIKKVIALLNSSVKDNSSYVTEELISKIIPELSNSKIKDIQKWCRENSIEFHSYSTLVALLERAVKNSDKYQIKQAKKAIIVYCKKPEKQFYHPEELIKRLDLFEFEGKVVFLRQVIKYSIERASKSSYYLNSFILHISDALDKYYPKLKYFAYTPLKEIVESSMKLSLSKA